MPQAGTIRAGRAFVELFTDDSKLVRGLKRASAKLKAFGESVRNIGLKLAGLGAAVVAPLVASTKVFAKVGDDLAKMSARTDFSVEMLSELGFAADLSGASMEVLETGIRKMQRTLVEAAQGSKAAQDALAMLGLTVADLAGLSPEEQLKLIADRLARIEDPAFKTAAAMELFGRSGTELLPMLSGGAAGIEPLQEQARKLGLTLSTEDPKAAERFSDTLAILWKVLKQGVFVVGSALVPVLSQLAQWVTKVVVSAGEWIKRNKELAVTVLQVAVGIVAAGELALAVAAGVVPVRVDVPDEDYPYRLAEVTDGVAAHLTAVKRGSAAILWREGGTGVQWALVRLGNLPQPSVFPVDLAQSGGQQGDDQNPATWTYDVTDPFTGQTLVSGVDPTAAPHKWQRPSVGYIIPATFGYAHWNEEGELVLGWINETADQEACESSQTQP